jgi:hypothetical protein
MSKGPYFTGKSGTRYTYSDIAERIRKEAPHTLSQHIFVQLEAIGLLEEMRNGATPCGLPYSFAEACYTPGPWDCNGRTTMYAAPHEADVITMIEVRANVTGDGWDTVAFIEAIWPGADANARLIVAAPALLEALRLAQRALNTAPRFRVGDTDSYKIAATVDNAIARATAA